MRKLNKLLALVLAMVMVLGLTATAFAVEGGDKTEDPKTESGEPADKAPAEGVDADKAPAEGEDADKTPAEGEDADKAPAEGDDAGKTPADGEDDKTPDTDPYADVADWAKEAVAAVVGKKLIDMGETGFNPAANMTRADLVVALYRLSDSPANAEDAVNPFTDVADDAAYKDAVIWAKDKGIVAGKSETSFDPNGAVTRQEIAKILFVYAGAKNVEEDNLAIFADVSDIAAWAKDYVNWAVASKLISGVLAAENTKKMDPNGTATREQVAVLLDRYINTILTPAEGDKAPAEGEDDAKAPDEGNKPADDKAPAEGDKPAADKAPAEGDKPAADKAPAEGDKPADNK